MATCSKCQVHEVDVTGVWCRACRREYDAARYQRLKSRFAAQRKANRRRALAWMDSIKESRPCEDCGRFYPACVMDWDHRPGTEKVENVSDLVRYARRRMAMEEIQKCDLVCSNCHRMRTQLRRIGANHPLDRLFTFYWRPSPDRR